MQSQDILIQQLKNKVVYRGNLEYFMHNIDFDFYVNILDWDMSQLNNEIRKKI